MDFIKARQLVRDGKGVDPVDSQLRTFLEGAGRDEINHLLYVACKRGQLTAARWLFETFAITAREIIAESRCWQGRKITTPFRIACWWGHMDVVQWLFGALPGLFENDLGALINACSRGRMNVADWLLANDWVPRGRVRHLGGLFWFFCERGQLDLARWLLPWVKINPAKVARRYPDSVSGPGSCFDCCFRGHIETARWLTEVFALTRLEATQNGNAALAGVCREGQLEAARWLCETFSLTRSDALEALSTAPCLFDPTVHAWLVATFGLTREDLRPNAEKSFRAACQLGKTGTARWLQAEFVFSRAEVMAGCCRAFEWACWGGHVDTARWLHATFVVTPEEAKLALRVVRQDRTPRNATWLIAEFGLQPQDANPKNVQDARAQLSRACGVIGANIANVRLRNFGVGRAGVTRDPATTAAM